MGKVKTNAKLEKARKLLQKRIDMELVISELRKQVALDEAEAKLEQIKADLVRAMENAGVDQVEVDGCHATLVRQSYGAMFIATADDYRALDEIPKDRPLIPLRKIIFNKFKNDKDKAKEIWKRVTKRVVVFDAIDEVVAEGLLTPDEIAPSFIEKQKRPYARLFKD